MKVCPSFKALFDNTGTNKEAFFSGRLSTIVGQVLGNS